MCVGVAYCAYFNQTNIYCAKHELAKDTKMNGTTLPTGNSQPCKGDMQKQAINVLW